MTSSSKSSWFDRTQGPASSTEDISWYQSARMSCTHHSYFLAYLLNIPLLACMSEGGVMYNTFPRSAPFICQTHRFIPIHRPPIIPRVNITRQSLFIPMQLIRSDKVH